MEHVAIAHRICRSIRRSKTGAVLAQHCARQGDVILMRVGEASNCVYTDRERTLVVGAHGAHHLEGAHTQIAHNDPRLIVDGAIPAEGGFDLVGEGLLVHTDVPSARHAAIRLVPGMWRWHRLQELDIELSIVKVAD